MELDSRFGFEGEGVSIVAWVGRSQSTGGGMAGFDGLWVGLWRSGGGLGLVIHMGEVFSLSLRRETEKFSHPTLWPRPSCFSLSLISKPLQWTPPVFQQAYILLESSGCLNHCDSPQFLLQLCMTGSVAALSWLQVPR